MRKRIHSGLCMLVSTLLVTTLFLTSCTHQTLPSTTTAKPSSEPTTQTKPVPDYFEPVSPENLTNEDSTPIIIYSWNDEFKGLIDKYYAVDHPDFSYDCRITEITKYQDALDAVLAAGDGAPDIFLMEADFAKKYVDSDNTLGIAELGITHYDKNYQLNYNYDDLSSQFGAAYFCVEDASHAVKALTWQVSPGGVFYNRELAKTYLGSDDPAVVQKSFASFDAFMAMAQKLNTDSAGKVKAISGYDDIWRSFANTRATGWVVDGKINIDPQMDKYLDYAKQIKDEGLSFETAQWSADWTANMSNSSVLSYWGPMWLLNPDMSISYAAAMQPNPGKWGVCAPPVSFAQGGSFIAASRFDNNKKTTYDLLKYFTLDAASMGKMAADGIFVNNWAIMEAVGKDPKVDVSGVDMENPYSVLNFEAMKLDLSAVTANDPAINAIFQQKVAAYMNGEFASVADAEAAFIKDCTDAGVLQ